MRMIPRTVLVLAVLLVPLINGITDAPPKENTKYDEDVPVPVGRAYTTPTKTESYDRDSYDSYEKRNTLRDQLKAAGATAFLHHIDKVGLGYIIDGRGLHLSYVYL